MLPLKMSYLIGIKTGYVGSIACYLPATTSSHIYVCDGLFLFVYILGAVVQSTIRGNAGLNFDLLFLFKHFCRKLRFKTIKKKSSSDIKNICLIL